MEATRRYTGRSIAPYGHATALGRAIASYPIVEFRLLICGQAIVRKPRDVMPSDLG